MELHVCDLARGDDVADFETVTRAEFTALSRQVRQLAKAFNDLRFVLDLHLAGHRAFAEAGAAIDNGH